MARLSSLIATVSAISTFMLPVHSAVLATPTPTATPAVTKVDSAPAPPITLAPGFTVTTTVIAGSTYPIFEVGGQGGYNLNATSFSATGLLGITLGNVYNTLPNGQVYPAFELYVNEADSELFTIPGVLTFRDGGISTDYAQSTDVSCSVGVGNGGCSNLAGLVTGTILGQPFTQVGALTPVYAEPSTTGGTFILGVTASASQQYGSSSFTGDIGAGIVTAPSYTSAGIAATGLGDYVGAAYENINGTTVFVLSVCETLLLGKLLGVCTTVLA